MSTIGKYKAFGYWQYLFRVLCEVINELSDCEP